MGNLFGCSKSRKPTYREVHEHIAVRTGIVEGSDTLSFPAPKDININMMPFVIGDVTSLPADYQHYWPLIAACWISPKEKGKVGYLTIDERLVKQGESQRRPGLHVETPGTCRVGGGENVCHMWGGGKRQRKKQRKGCVGGIFMASTVAQSCRVWNVVLKDDTAIRTHGDIEHLRPLLQLCDPYDTSTKDRSGTEWLTGESRCLLPNHIAWMTDRTPHESVPLTKDTYRQYFRVVTSNITVWYAEHSTANPLGTTPPQEVQVVSGDKFAAVGGGADGAEKR